MGVFGPAVRERPLLQEVRPERAPLHVPLDPPIGLLQRVQVHELLGEPVQLDARLQPRPAGRVALDLAERMEQASLDPGFRPLRRDRLGEPRATVGHDHLGRRDPREQGLPGPGGLGLGHVPAEHVLVAAGDGDHRVAGYVDAVDVDGAVHLVDRLRHGPDPPEPPRLPPEGAALAGHRGLPLLERQPIQGHRELPSGHVVSVHGAGAAGSASPPLGPRAGLPVPLHWRPARRADLRLQANLPKIATFLLVLY